jgi:hypothetical protein
VEVNSLTEGTCERKDSWVGRANRRTLHARSHACTHARARSHARTHTHTQVMGSVLWNSMKADTAL